MYSLCICLRVAAAELCTVIVSVFAWQYLTWPFVDDKKTIIYWIYTQYIIKPTKLLWKRNRWKACKETCTIYSCVYLPFVVQGLFREHNRALLMEERLINRKRVVRAAPRLWFGEEINALPQKSLGSAIPRRPGLRLLPVIGSMFQYAVVESLPSGFPFSCLLMFRDNLESREWLHWDGPYSGQLHHGHINERKIVH